MVLGGAALSGGLASPSSTWVAAFFVTLLNQMLKVLGLTNASQFVVFGLAIVVGMLISGDRIAELIGRLLLRPSLRKYIDGDDTPSRQASRRATRTHRPTETLVAIDDHNTGRRGSTMATQGMSTTGRNP